MEFGAKQQMKGNAKMEKQLKETQETFLAGEAENVEAKNPTLAAMKEFLTATKAKHNFIVKK